MSDGERRAEATQIVLGIIDLAGKLQYEQNFIRQMGRPGPVSVKQLNWLRYLGAKLNVESGESLNG